jgi:acetolactate decarboxylase
MTASIVQYNPFYALQQGFYDGPTTVRDLKQHGDFGMGAMNGLDGEMVGEGGSFYQIGIDGTLTEAPDDACLPWAMVTRFSPTDEVLHVDPGIDYPGLQALLKRQTRWNNLYLAFRIECFATSVQARSLPKQSKPYPLLANVPRTPYTFTDVPLVGVGFISPSYVGNIDPAGCHLHVMTTDRRRGGHLLDFTLRSGTLRVSPIRRLDLRLPHECGFDGAPTP